MTVRFGEVSGDVLLVANMLTEITIERGLNIDSVYNESPRSWINNSKENTAYKSISVANMFIYFKLKYL